MAEVDYFLKIDGIPGESQDDEHKDEIEVVSWYWSETLTGLDPGSAGVTGKLKMEDFNLVIPVSRASPELFLACASAKHISQAVLTCRRGDGDGLEFLKYTFSDVVILSFQVSGSAASGLS